MKNLLLLLFFCISVLVYAQKAPKGVQIDVHNNDDFEGLEMLDSSIANARIIMTGENHTYVNFNSHMEMKMLRFLNKKTGLRYFIIELGEARAHYLNRYIFNTDSMAEKYLKASTSPRYMDLFKRIRKYNTGLADSLKIIIRGIDVERFFDLPLLRLSELLPKSGVPNNLRSFCEVARGTASYLEKTGLEDYEKARDKSKNAAGRSYFSYQKFYINPTVNDLVKHWDSLQGEFKAWLGSNYAEIDQVMGWLKQYQQWRKYENTTFQYIWREENIFRNLTRLLDENPNEKFYGQFGRCHIAYEEQNGDCSWYGYHSVVNKLKTRYSKDIGSVLSIGIFYKGTGDNTYYSDYESREVLSKEIEELSDNTKLHTVTLFDLGKKEAELPELKKKFSYVIINNRFEASEDNDSVESEVVEPKKKNEGDFEPYKALTGGIYLNSVSSKTLDQYLKSNGYSSGYKNLPWFGLEWQWVRRRFSVGISFASQKQQKLFGSDTGDMHYKAGAFSLRFIGYPVVNKSFQAGLGINYSQGYEKIIWEPKNVNFITVNNPRKFINPVQLLGPVVQMQKRFSESVYFGLETGKYFDISKAQWKYQGTSAFYSSENKVTKGLGGFWFGAKLGITFSEYYYK